MVVPDLAGGKPQLVAEGHLLRFGETLLCESALEIDALLLLIELCNALRARVVKMSGCLLVSTPAAFCLLLSPPLLMPAPAPSFTRV